MTPRIIVLSGSSKGSEISLGDDEIFIGRDVSNMLSLADLAVSRRHCRIHRTDAGYELIDIDSHNGTFLNGVPIGRKLLSHGDTIRVGACEVLFLSREEDTAGTIDLGSNSPPPGADIKAIRIDETIDFPRVDLEMGRMARDFSALLRISSIISSIRDLGHLQREILRLLLEVVPADHAAIALFTALDERPTSICCWGRRSREKCRVEIRGSIVSKAFWERSAVSMDANQQTGEPCNVLCVPLVAVQRTLGVIYLTSSEPASPFVDDHINFLASASRIAAVALENIIALDKISSENQQLKEEIHSSMLVGKSRQIQKLETFIARVAGEDVTVLIRGESGTGKELVARAIHFNSPRASRPFVAINCAAIPESLLESELFGHEKGAFTGAVMAKKGKLETAEDGTLFLDEIGELAPSMQAKLLRVLQQREFERLGGTRYSKFSARVVAATNKDLERAIKTGEFRQDLYYRLNVVSVSVPPLRNRREDIPLLALYFASKYAARSKRAFKGISTGARALLLNYSWPGNVRELENAIEHAIVLGVSDEILPEDLPSALVEEQGAQLDSSRYHGALNNLKKELILDALRSSEGNFPEAAKLLGIHPKYLFRLVRNLKLRTELDE